MKRVLLIGSLSLYLTARAGDIPERGASTFDYLTEKSGLIFDGRPLDKRAHPYPRLLKALNEYAPLFAAVIPFGRSLQKMAAYPESLRFPRLVVATRDARQSINTPLRGRLFIGYVEPSKKLEIISYNPQLARYEFQIVDNFYPGGRAVARYASRQLCLRCHQGGVPIFAGGDWLETTSLNQPLRKMVAKAMGSDHYFGIPLERNLRSPDFDLISSAERFDDSVFAGAQLIAFQTAWQNLCAASLKDPQCPQKLLSWMLITNILPQLSLVPDGGLLASYEKVMGEGTVPLPSQRIPDHNPIVEGELSYSFPKDVDPSLPRTAFSLIMNSEKDAKGTRFAKFLTFIKEMGRAFFTKKDFELLGQYAQLDMEIQKVKWDDDKDIDQLFVRTNKIWCLPSPVTIQNIFNGKSQKEIDLKCLGKDFAKLYAALLKVKFEPGKPLIRSSVLNSLQKNLGVKFWDQLCCQGNVDPRFFKTISAEKYLTAEEIKDQRLKPFFKYCSECHLHQDLPPPFLAGARESSIVKQLKARKALIKFRIQNQQMPPQFARIHPDKEERSQLLEALGSL